MGRTWSLLLLSITLDVMVTGCLSEIHDDWPLAGFSMPRECRVVESRTDNLHNWQYFMDTAMDYRQIVLHLKQTLPPLGYEPAGTFNPGSNGFEIRYNDTKSQSFIQCNYHPKRDGTEDPEIEYNLYLCIVKK